MARPCKPQKPASRAKSGVINKEQLAEKGGTIPSGRGHWVRKAMLAMKVEDLLFIHKDDWNWKGAGNTPGRIVNSLNAKSGPRYTIAIVADQSGWVIERVE